WFDIANYYIVEPQVDKVIPKLKKYIYYIHCKNYVNNDLGIHYVELGKGIIDYKTIIHEIHEHFIDLIFSLEVHEKEIDKKAEVVRKSYLTLNEYINGG
ncbi:TPA: sugar phosphate isomerase/epimerase, partial [Streptococcus pyogenes]|nr:sugar phosphate isomerase/epimerase [Streptococcus pyogenes]HEP3786733.1 sugar phosphate isomerase/epimerase [Streptococcus pyogenes]HEP5704449.1 sugar phosphate isomerase/epimerase [Streptococcus pyogenes]HEQ8442484.1 sugar phosphate isomerase/epimerase [Streptococcus pyogenes]HER3918563.1 sugar phosphate isomerase/epimerase [Streptococcus pyogenes]